MTELANEFGPVQKLDYGTVVSQILEKIDGSTDKKEAAIDTLSLAGAIEQEESLNRYFEVVTNIPLGKEVMSHKINKRLLNQAKVLQEEFAMRITKKSLLSTDYTQGVSDTNGLLDMTEIPAIAILREVKDRLTIKKA